MEATIMGHMRTALRIRSFISSHPKMFCRESERSSKLRTRVQDLVSRI